MRGAFLWVAAAAGLAMASAAPPARALDLVQVPPWDEAMAGLDRVILPMGEPLSIHDAADRVVRGPPPVDPVTGGPSGLGASGGGAWPGAGGAPASPAGAAAAGAGFLLWALGFGGLATALGLGWRHLHARNALDHPTRLRLLALLRAQPGLHLRALARGAGLSPQRAAYHLDTLERLGVVASQPIAGRRCYFEAGAGPAVRRALAEAALQPGATARDVLAFVEAHPGASQSDVARHLGLLPGRARWHLQRLTAQGRLDQARLGKALTYRPRDVGRLRHARDSRDARDPLGPGFSTGPRP